MQSFTLRSWVFSSSVSKRGCDSHLYTVQALMSQGWDRLQGGKTRMCQVSTYMTRKTALTDACAGPQCRSAQYRLTGLEYAAVSTYGARIRRSDWHSQRAVVSQRPVLLYRVSEQDRNLRGDCLSALTHSMFFSNKKKNIIFCSSSWKNHYPHVKKTGTEHITCSVT